MTFKNITCGQKLDVAVMDDLSTLVDALTVGSVSNSTTQTVIGTVTIPANDADLGDIYRLRVYGSVDSTSTPTLTLRLRFTDTAGGILVTFYNAGSPRASTDEPWYLDVDAMVTAVGASANLQIAGGFRDRVTSSTAANTALLNNVAAGGFDSTVNQDLVVTAQWNTASSSDVARTLEGGLFRM